MHMLDNPIWNALGTCQAHFAESYGVLRRFPPEVTPLGGFPEANEEGFEALRGLLKSGGGIGIFLPGQIEAPAGLEIPHESPLLQMILENEASSHAMQTNSPALRTHEYVELGPADVPEMVELTALMKPGPFGTRTREMGTYIGIRKDGRLAAMAGERLKLPGYTEISAVCTHPEHLGKGYAGFLMTVLAGRIRARGEVPFLHVRPQNERAIQVYERLGYERRLLYHYAVFRAAAGAKAPGAGA